METLEANLASTVASMQEAHASLTEGLQKDTQFL